MKQHLINITAIIGYLAIIGGLFAIAYLAASNPN